MPENFVTSLESHWMWIALQNSFPPLLIDYHSPFGELLRLETYYSGKNTPDTSVIARRVSHSGSTTEKPAMSIPSRFQKC